jgi:hypothetical protein
MKWLLTRKLEKRREEAMETEKIQSIEAGQPNGGALVQVAGGTISDLARAIGDSVGSKLRETIDAEIDRGVELAVIVDGDGYKRAAEQRKRLLGLINMEGDASAPGRLRFLVSLVITSADGKKLGIVREESVGTESVKDFYEPMANLLHKLHRAVTSGREELVGRVEAARALLETNCMAYEDAQRERERAAQERQAAINAQNERTQHAEHYVGLLCQHGLTKDECLGMLVNPIDTVTAEEVNSLKEQLEHSIEAEEEERRQADAKSAIETAKQLGFDGLADLLEDKAQAPTPISTPVYVPPPPTFRPAASAVAASMTPRAPGVGRTAPGLLRITNPNLITAWALLPPDGKEMDSDNYPRLKALAKVEGKRLEQRCPGIEVYYKPKMTQR